MLPALTFPVQRREWLDSDVSLWIALTGQQIERIIQW